MLQVKEFDLKTGKGLSEYEPQTQQYRPKSHAIAHSYLEHWLSHHGLSEREIWLARFYPGVNAEDQKRLEQDGKVLVFANGERGYFTDGDTARLLTQGDRSRAIAPLYQAGLNQAHHLVAYGSLAISDGFNSMVFQPEQRPVRLLVLDEVQRDYGPRRPLDSQGMPVAVERLNSLFERLGDGTMLVSPELLEALVQPSTDDLGKDINFNHDINDRDKTRIHQFRAATPDLPGLLKGTLRSSVWTDELAVDVICSVSVFKGDDGQLSAPGLHELSQLWVNRKSKAQYRSQAVGVQLKGTIPGATATELNPRVLEQAEEFARQAGDVNGLAETYVNTQAALRQEGGVGANAGTATQTEVEQPVLLATLCEPEDWLSQIIQQDQYGVMLNGFPSVIDKLERFVRHQRLDHALRGIRIPSAMAQPHSQLKPWEVCNRNLPAGAIVAYYRSPVPNISAVALAINNPQAIERTDREAYQKHGVAYLNPWTAQHVAITDFDGDVNAYFIGYLPTGPDLPSWVREQLSETEVLSLPQQYEAARQLFAGLIGQLNQDVVPARIRLGDYPRTVAEVIERTAPERQPPVIEKQAKLKHSWADNETLAQATWRAWSITAENPIGRVANVGMVLQSFASECLYARSDEAKEALLRQISSHARTLLNRADQGKLEIPDNDSLTAKGLPNYNFKARLQALARAGPIRQSLPQSESGQQPVHEHLQMAHDLFWDVANGLNAANLQTAVDGVKSARGIDETLHQFALALQYKPHLLRQHRQDPTVYTAQRTLPSNTDEPMGWMVEAVNDLYQESALARANNVGMRFGPLLQGIEFSPAQQAEAQDIVTGYLGLMAQRSELQRQLRLDASASRQPSLTLTSVQTGRSLRVERLIDGTTGHEAAVQDLWRSTGPTNWKVLVEPVPQSNPPRFSVKRSVEGKPEHLLGWVSTADAQRYQLGQYFQTRRQLELHCPVVQVHPPLVLENDMEALLERAQNFLQQTKARIPVEQQAAYAAAMWSLKLPTGEPLQGGSGRLLEKQAKLGMGVALQLFPGVVGDRLGQLPPLKLSGWRYRAVTPEPGEYELVTRPYRYLDRAGYVQKEVAFALVGDDPEPKHLGYGSERGLQLPAGLRLQAELRYEAPEQASSPSGPSGPSGPTLQVIALLGREPPAASGLQPAQHTSSGSSLYAPTYGELQDWWRAARVQQDEGKMAEIRQLGQRLGEGYRSSLAALESISSESVSQLPIPNKDYRSLAVVLNVAQQQQMKADQACDAVMGRVWVSHQAQQEQPLGQNQRGGAGR